MTASKPGPWLVSSCLALILAGAVPTAAEPADLRLAAADSDDPGTVEVEPALDDLERYRLGLLKLKGHLGVARALLQRREPGADYHLREPFQAIFATLQPTLAERDAPLTSDVLELLDRATDAPPQPALNLLDNAASAIDGSFAQPGGLSPDSALSLAEALLREAVDLYQRSVTDNEVVDLRRYQTGRGYVIQAEALVRHSTGLAGRPGHEALLASVVLIRQAWPSVIPPPIVFDPDSVSGRLQEAVAAMDKLR